MTLKKLFISALLFSILSLSLLPLATQAATSTTLTQPLQYSAWIAYWKKAGGVADAIIHMPEFSELHPFGYSVSTTGVLHDTMLVDSQPWPILFQSAAANRVGIMPTVMWSDTDAMYSILSNTTKRNSLVSQIASAANTHNFTGADIDFENKNLATGPYFSKFLTSLSASLHSTNKTLSCTIEPRTPLNHLYVTVPKNQKYGNDYAVIASVCDEVKIMAYDQGNADIVLNKAKGKGTYYMPIADPAWVEQVIMETLKTIPAKKVVLGVPTYAREFIVSTSSIGYQYKIVHSLSYKDAMSLASAVGAIPTRNNAGELSFSFAASSVTHFVSIEDASSIADKIALAKRYGLKGVAVFKIDGDGDPAIWNVLK